jgi:predicted ATPase
MPIIKPWQVYHFHDTGRTAKVKQIGSIHDNAYLREDASNLAAFLYKLKLKHEKQYKAICLVIQKVAPFFGDFILEPTLEDNSSIELKWHEKGSDYPFTAHGLHSFAINILGGLIRSISKSKQIILSTQSVSLLDQFETDDVIVTQRVNQESLFNRLIQADLEKWLEDYSLSELWEKNYLKGRPS